MVGHINSPEAQGTESNGRSDSSGLARNDINMSFLDEKRQSNDRLGLSASAPI
jgi:hypothetical protein